MSIMQWEGREASFGTCLGVEGLNQIDQRLPRHYLVHFSRKLLTFSPLFGGALLLITKAQPLASHQSRAGLQLFPHSREYRG